MWGLIPAYIIQQDDQVPVEQSTLFITDSSSDLKIDFSKTNKRNWYIELHCKKKDSGSWMLLLLLKLALKVQTALLSSWWNLFRVKWINKIHCQMCSVPLHVLAQENLLFLKIGSRKSNLGLGNNQTGFTWKHFFLMLHILNVTLHHVISHIYCSNYVKFVIHVNIKWDF